MQRTHRIAAGLLGVAVIGLLTVRLGPSTILGMLHRVGWALWLVSALYAVHVVLRAVALWRGLPDGRLPFGDVLRVRAAGEAVEVFTFTGPWLAEPAKGWLLMRHGLSATEAAGYIALEYLLYTLAAAWMAAIALAALLGEPAMPPALRLPVYLIEAAVAGATTVFLFAVVSGRGVLAALAGRRVKAPGFAAPALAAEDVVVRVVSGRPWRLAELILWQALGHLLLAAEIALVCFLLGDRRYVRDALIFEGAAKFINTAFFFVPGQVGAQEGVYALIAAALGLPGALGLTLALTRRLRNVVVALGGLALTWAMPTGSTPQGHARA